jgi:flagellar biosynthesis/type III secretory pathway M-ring protein FliF/YscJ
VDRFVSTWSDISARLRQIWEGQNRQNRMLAIGGGAVLVLGIIFLTFLYTKQPDYETLFPIFRPKMPTPSRHI